MSSETELTIFRFPSILSNPFQSFRMESRRDLFRKCFPQASRFRERQFFRFLFEDVSGDWNRAMNFSKADRELLSERIPFSSLVPECILEGVKEDVYKAILRLSDGAKIETVLMRNARGGWTVCVSTQVGCAMNCSFCATGKMGFSRNLSEDEIVDQYRIWKKIISDRGIEGRVSNIVCMGMGEPLANYENVKGALKALLEYTDLGPTRMTVSTVGLLPMMEHLLSDSEWPPVRMAVSLHSADAETRKNIMPTSYDGFLEKLAGWTKRYFLAFPERRRHLTFEYILLDGVNDTDGHAEKLARFSNQIGKVKVNLIPFNETGRKYSRSSEGGISNFQKILLSKGVDVTRRRAMGEDIAAACGQLIQETRKKSRH